MITNGDIIFKSIKPQKQDAEVRDATKKVDKLTDKRQKVLFRTSSVFPFSFFPDELIIDPLKIDIVEREFFASEVIRSIPFDQVVEVQASSGPFFSTLKIIGKGLKSENVEISFLKKDEARKAKKIIDGLVLCKSNDVDLANLDDVALTAKMEELGKTPDVLIKREELADARN